MWNLKLKDFKVRILSVQKLKEEFSETIEFFTQAKGKTEGDTFFLVYKESEVSGLEGTLTKLKISSDQVLLTRSGAVRQEVLFDAERPCRFEYETPYGSLLFEARTLAVVIERRENQIDFVELSYELFDGLGEKWGDYQMKLFITKDEAIE